MNLDDIIDQYATLLRIVDLPFTKTSLKILSFASKYNGEWFQAKEMIETLNIRREVIYRTLNHLEHLGIVEKNRPEIPEHLGVNARKRYKKEKYGSTKVRTLYRIRIDGFKKLIDDKIRQLEELKKNL